MIRIEMRGDEQVMAYFTGLPSRIYAGVFKGMSKLGYDLLSIVVDKKLSGEVLKRKTGTLAGAQNLEIKETGTEVAAVVGFNKNTAPHGLFHERGVPKFWLIEAKRAKALRFEFYGQIVFRKSVMHPPLPERSFLRKALIEIFPRVRPELQAAIAEVL